MFNDSTTEIAPNTEAIIQYASNLGIQVLTLFTFSTENWTRPKTEVTLLMNLLATVLDKKLKKCRRQKNRDYYRADRQTNS